MGFRLEDPIHLSKLNKKIIIHIVLISTLITTIITSISFFIDYNKKISDLERTIKQIENTNLKSIEQSLWEINTNQLNIQLEGLLSIRDIYSIYHLDKSGKKGIEKKKSDTPPSYLFEKELTVNFTFEGSKVKMGTIVIVAYKDKIYDELIARAIYVFLTQTLKTLIVTLAMFLIFSKYISKHITRITEYFSLVNIEADKSFPRLKLDKNYNDQDEIDLLVESINNMTRLVGQANRENRSLIAKQEKRIEEQEIMAINASKLAALGEMAAGIAHEINNPATVISLSTRSLKKEAVIHSPDDTKMHDKIEKIDSSVTRIKNIIDSIRSFSRHSDTDGMRNVNFIDIVKSSLNFCTERFKSENLNLIVDIPNTKLIVSVKESEISQVILNLINNAYDAISNENDKWIKIEVKYDKKNITLGISDSGAGIPESLRDKVFNPFFTTKEVGKGTGLGLSLSKKLLENNNGKLELDQNNKNTKFVISLPLIL